MKKTLKLLALAAMAMMVMTTACKKEKTLGEEDPNIPPVGNTGKYDKPYTVAEARTKQGNDTMWVVGYIVGNYNGDSVPKDKYVAPFYSDFNVLLGDTTTATGTNNLICVQLAAGGQRTDMGLVAKPNIKGTKVWLKGIGTSYNAMAGLKTLIAYSFTKPTSDVGGGEEPIDPTNVTEISVKTLRALNADPAKGTAKVTIPADRKIVGIVVSDRSTKSSADGNLQLVSEDNSAGIMVRFATVGDHGFNLGDKVQIVVSNQSLEFYNKLLQINGVPNKNASRVSASNSVTPVTATIAQITADMDTYESRLVKIQNVTITNTGNTYGGNTGNGTLTDASGNMTLYTRTAATFASSTIPAAPQHITAFVTRYADVKQVSVRNLNDIVPADPNAPVLQITSASSISLAPSAALSHTITTYEANLSSTTAITTSALPSWITLSGSTLSGTAPNTNSTETITITATNGTTTATQTLVITVSSSLTLAAWDFNGQASLETFAATTYNSNLNATPANNKNITRGAGAVSSTGANSFRTVGFKNDGIAVTNTDYFEVKLVPNSGKTISLSSIEAKFAGTATYYASPGVSSQFAYSLDGTTFTLIGTATQSVNLAVTFDLSGVAALQNVTQTITLRYYASGQTATGGWGFSSASAGTNGLAIIGSIN